MRGAARTDEHKVRLYLAGMYTTQGYPVDVYVRARRARERAERRSQRVLAVRRVLIRLRRA